MFNSCTALLDIFVYWRITSALLLLLLLCCLRHSASYTGLPRSGAHADFFGDRSFAVAGPAPGTTYLMQSEIRLRHSQRS